MSSKTVRTLYRLFLRQARTLERQGLQELPIRAPVNREAWMGGPQHEWAPPRDEFYLQSFQRLAPWAAQDATSGVLTPVQLRELVRRAFRAPPPAEGGTSKQLDQAFESLRLLADQVLLDEATSSCTTDGVHVEVSTAHMGSQADLDPLYDDDDDDGAPKKHYWTYRIRVSNVGTETVQLLARHWVISDPQGKVVAEVPKGSRGVVGCTPLIKPGDCFQYHSGTDLETPGGSMHGSFQMAVVDPKKPHVWLRTFDAEVAPFRFFMPGSRSGGSGSSSGGGSSGGVA